MQLHRTAFVAVALAVVMGTACTDRPPPVDVVQRAIEENITDRFVWDVVRPSTDVVATLAHRGADLPAELLASNRVTLVEVVTTSGERRTLFSDESIRPPEKGFATGVPNAHKIGVFFPVSLDQAEIEVRMNYHCDVGDFVAVHVVVASPLHESKRK